MKNKITIALAVLALGASAFVSNAQDNNTPPNGGGQHEPGGLSGMMGHRRPPSPLFTALDVNHDGVIDADEIANASAELLTLDKNGDGKLTRDELRPSQPPRWDSSASGDTNSPPRWDGPNGDPGGAGRNGHRPPPDPLMQALDVNHDGIIDADEIANAPAELRTLDKNGDGKLTQDELRPPRPPQNGGPESGNDRPDGQPPGDQQDSNTAPNGPPPGNQ